MICPRLRREEWLSAHVARALGAMQLYALTEEPDGKGGSIDVAVLRSQADPALRSVVEVKNYHCCHLSDRTRRHGDLWNAYRDFLKRAHLGVPMLQVVFFCTYLSLGTGGAAAVRSEKEVARTLKRPADRRLRSFAEDLSTEFGGVCDVYPPPGEGGAPHASWRAEDAGTALDVRAWVLRLRPTVAAEQLWDGLRRRAPRRYYNAFVADMAAKGKGGPKATAGAPIVAGSR